jgi:hypothetical protein
MTIEIILWIVAGLVIEEVFYVIWYYRNNRNKEHDWVSKKEWWEIKIGSIMITMMFMMSQVVILGIPFPENGGLIFHYINLLYEFLVVGTVALLFYLNKRLADFIDKKQLPKPQRRNRRRK